MPDTSEQANQAPTRSPRDRDRRSDKDECVGDGIFGEGSEVARLVVAYAKQETIEPLRGLLKPVGFGIGGGVTFGAGTVLVLLGVLRLLQTETGTAMTGHWSWAPYGLTAALAGFIAVFFAVLILRGDQRSRARRPTTSSHRSDR